MSCVRAGQEVQERMVGRNEPAGIGQILFVKEQYEGSNVLVVLVKIGMLVS